MVRRYKRIDEEIARWTLECHLKWNPVARSNWWIAFTNPTAGPWKRLMAQTPTGPIEVYRFNREEERPDLVLVNDALKLVLIIEAKDQASKLLQTTQMTKSIDVVDNMILQLQQLSSSETWETRAQFNYIPGFLWAQTERSEQNTELISQLFYAICQTRENSYISLANFVIMRVQNNLVPEIHLYGDFPVDKTALSATFNFPMAL